MLTVPSGLVYTRAAWPGALVVRAAIRLSDLVNAWNSGVRWEEIVVFGGKRPLQSDKEGYEACCKAIGIEPYVYDVLAPSLYLWHQMKPETELDMMRWLWSCAIMPSELYELPVTFVDAPMKPPTKEGGSPVRPTTEDTIAEWLKSKPTQGCLLLSSGAPYGMAQDEAFWMLLESHGHTVETFGHAAPDLPIENFMREVAGTVNRIRKARKA